MSEEIGFDIQVKQNNFKTAIEKFCERIEIVKNEFSLAIKNKQISAAEFFEMAKLQKAMVFELDNKFILGIDSGASNAGVVP